MEDERDEAVDRGQARDDEAENLEKRFSSVLKPGLGYSGQRLLKPLSPGPANNNFRLTICLVLAVKTQPILRVPGYLNL